MPPPMIPPKLPPLEFIAAEAFYSSIIFLICFLIYHRLREVYKLSDYRGFHFFSNTFLFLGLAYFLRFVVLLLSASGVMFEEISLEGLRGIMAFSMAFLAYSGSAAILYTIYSLLWRWLERFPGEVVINGVALVIALTSLLSRMPLVFLISQLALVFLLVAAIFVNYSHFRHESRSKRAYPLYILLFVFWLLNISLTFRFLPLEFRFAIYTLSVAVILIIAYRVLRKL